MSSRWRLKEADGAETAALAQALDLPEPVARILISRGIKETDAANRFLKKSMGDLLSPLKLPGMDFAATRLSKAIRTGEKILIHGDFDADGITSAALLTLFLRDLGVDPIPFVPNRLIEGHGISRRAIELAKLRGVSLLVTCDCGSSSGAEIEELRRLDVETIVTDHHAIPANVPSGAILVNPQLEGTEEEHEDLSGVGVAFMLGVAVRTRLREEGFFDVRPEPNLKSYLDIVALGTLADMAALCGQNRILVAHGLTQIASSIRPGFQAMRESAGIESKMIIRTDDVGFRLAPRINAAARLGHSTEALELLLSQDMTAARALALDLEKWNAERRALQERMSKIAEGDAREQVEANSPAIVVSSRDFHSGIVGLVAQKMASQYGVPAFIFAIEGAQAKGSVRSRNGVNVVKAMESCSHLLENFGGHREAGGCSLKTSQLEAFKNCFQEAVRAQGFDAVQEVLIDAELNLRHLNERVLKGLDALAPYGMGNPEPLFIATARTVGARPREVGAGHLRMTLQDNKGGGSFGAIGFGLWKQSSAWAAREVELVYTPEFNFFRGREEIQIRLKHLRTV